jgi:integrase
MSRRASRVRLARNVFRDAFGISGLVRKHGAYAVELRFPLGTALSEIRRAMEARREVEEAQAPDRPGRGSLAAIVARYLATLPAGVGHTDRAALLQPWIDARGEQLFAALTRGDVAEVLAQWRAAGLSASRANKRLSALRVAWHRIAPDAPPHPIERVARSREPVALVRGVPMPLVETVLAHVPHSASLHRLRVLAWTGQPPARVMQIQPHHVRWDRTPPELYVSPRRKGTGTADAWLPLLPQAQAALRDLFLAKATGAFQTSALGRFLKRGLTKAQAELRQEGRKEDADRLNGFRLYDLRHSFGTFLAEHTHDQWAVAEYLGHSNLATTARYVRGAASTRVRQAVATLAALVTPPAQGRVPLPQAASTNEGKNGTIAARQGILRNKSDARNIKPRKGFGAIASNVAQFPLNEKQAR